MLRKSIEGERQFEKDIYSSFSELRQSYIKTKFKLNNDGTRFGEPIKVEIECELNSKNIPKKFRKKNGKRSKNMTEQNVLI